jgi:hypothetical protein
VERMLQSSGRRVDLSSPFVDASLPDGSRLHVVIPDAGKAHYCRTHYCTKHLRRTGADVLWRSGQTVDPSRCSQSGGSSGSKSLSHCPEPGMGQSVGAVRPW